jgi:predicted RNA-binding protein
MTSIFDQLDHLANINALMYDDLDTIDAAKNRIEILEAENARLRQAIADEANRINIEGSAYHKAQLALDEIVVGLKQRTRAVLAATSGGE